MLITKRKIKKWSSSQALKKNGFSTPMKFELLQNKADRKVI